MIKQIALYEDLTPNQLTLLYKSGIIVNEQSCSWYYGRKVTYLITTQNDYQETIVKLLYQDSDEINPQAQFKPHGSRS